MSTMNPKTPSAQPHLTIKADDEVAKGRFANYAQIGHQAEQFVIDFAWVQNDIGWLLSRVILTPAHARRLATALAENIAKYEARFGAIPAGSTSPNLMVQ
jgi:hypothetical protein